jgi:hypothetical protein
VKTEAADSAAEVEEVEEKEEAAEAAAEAVAVEGEDADVEEEDLLNGPRAGNPRTYALHSARHHNSPLL